MSQNLDHLLMLAWRGRSAAASGGEHAAHRLTVALLDAMPILDGMAKNGVYEWATFCAHSPTSADELLYGGACDAG